MINYTFDRSDYPDMDWDLVDDTIRFCQDRIDEGFPNVVITAESLDDNEGLWRLWRGILMTVEDIPGRYSADYPKSYSDLSVNIGKKFISDGRKNIGDTGWCSLKWYRENGYAESFYISFQDLCSQIRDFKTNLDAFFDTILFGEV